MKAFRVDLVIATFALLVSAGATLSSLYQTKVIANQLSSSVWPYLTIDTESSPTSFALQIDNEGLGPALIRSATLLFDGRPVHEVRPLLEGFKQRMQVTARKAGTARSAISFDFDDVTSATVIRPGDRKKVFGLTDARIAALGLLGSRFTLELCYCSLLDACWTVRDFYPRVAVASCTPNAGLRY